MTRSLTPRLTVAWIALCLLTAAAWWLGDANGHREITASTSVTLGVLVMALIKIRLMIQEFMEVRAGPTWLRLWTDLWLVTLFAGVATLYLTGPPR